MENPPVTTGFLSQRANNTGKNPWHDFFIVDIVLADMLAIDTYICWKEQSVARDDHALSSMKVDNLTLSCYIQTQLVILQLNTYISKVDRQTITSRTDSSGVGKLMHLPHLAGKLWKIILTTSLSLHIERNNQQCLRDTQIIHRILC